MRKQATPIHNDLVEIVAQELQTTKDELAVTYQELRTTKDELAATKKELLATKQQLQTVNHAAQNQVAQSEQLDRLKEDFLSALNHELRSPLSNMNGMGLGLALVQKLVEHLQGTIQVESSEGWTTFTVCFTS